MALRAVALFSSGALTGGLALLGILHKRLQRSKRAKYVQTPHPDWQPGQPQPQPFSSDAMITVDPDTVDKASMYAFVISAVVPRPIAFISSMSAEGHCNLAPYSYFNVVAHNPPTVVIGCCRSPGRGGDHKDTLLNISETGWAAGCASDLFGRLCERVFIPSVCMHVTAATCTAVLPGLAACMALSRCC